MQSGDFQPYLNYFGIQDYFKCVCAIDNIPKSLKLNHFIICNIDKKNNPGLHWLIFLRYSKSTVVCFDSLSIDDHKKTLLSEYCKFTGVKTILFNETQFQSERSDSCGLFCLYFKRVSILFIDMVEVINIIYTSNLFLNKCINFNQLFLL